MFMLKVILPRWDCVCMHAILYLWLHKNVHQVTCFCFSFSFFLLFFLLCVCVYVCAKVQLIELCMQISEHSEKEVLARGVPSPLRQRGQDPRSSAHANATKTLVPM